MTMRTSRSARMCLALAAGALVFTSAAAAWGLDAYQDRRGLFSGLSVGMGMGEATEGDSDGEVGFNLRGRLGGGINKHLTADLEIGAWLHSGDQFDVTILTGVVGLNYFIVDGLYLRGMGGASQFSPDPGDGETGLAVGGGLGYEFFANSNLAVGFGADVLQHIYSDVSDFRVVSFGVQGAMY